MRNTVEQKTQAGPLLKLRGQKGGWVQPLPFLRGPSGPSSAISHHQHSSAFPEIKSSNKHKNTTMTTHNTHFRQTSSITIINITLPSPKTKLKRQMIKKISNTLLFWILICISLTAPFVICPRLVEISNYLVSNCSALGAV